MGIMTTFVHLLHDGERPSAYNMGLIPEMPGLRQSCLQKLADGQLCSYHPPPCGRKACPGGRALPIHYGQPGARGGVAWVWDSWVQADSRVHRTSGRPSVVHVISDSPLAQPYSPQGD